MTCIKYTPTYSVEKGDSFKPIIQSGRTKESSVTMIFLVVINIFSHLVRASIVTVKITEDPGLSPEVTGSHEENCPLTTTHWQCPVRKALNQTRITPDIPRASNFNSNGG